ncbi:hypothetical protein PAXRUDRAFT_20408 [Paxillus rubicundulus Ve08.2h10]|uniref:Uncharacterized protein n=1 Tax=Paxillus rubicundulus Ve08.2h10 TaxID=930991 RepID=A0A0D0D1Z2_9AGAM|nr:hypothetical protein PAXRUDRAFT_20408 [Paxillus rubicundulus Ve08.2h10]
MVQKGHPHGGIPSVAQKAKFGIYVGVTPSESIMVYHPLASPPPQSIPQASALELITTPVNPMLDPPPRPSSDLKDQIIKGLEVQVASLEKQVERIPDLELQMQRLHLEMANSHPKSTFLTLEAKGQPSSHLGLQLVSPSTDGSKLAPSPLHLLMHQQPHLGVEVEGNTSEDKSNDDARPPLPIPPPLTKLVSPVESYSSEVDMEIEDVDTE